MSEEKIQQLQVLEQNMQQLLLQKQNFQAQLMEIESAEEELKTSEVGYKILGNVMLKVPKEKLQKEIAQKKEMLQLRIKTVEKQEQSSKEKLTALRSEVLEGMKKKK